MTDSDRPPIEVSSSPTPGDDRSGSSRRQNSVWWAAGIFFIALVALVAVFSRGADDANADVALQDFEFQTPDGETVTLADFAGGNPMVVNYFAAWCAPCRAELPEFEAVSRELADDIIFVGISRDNVTDSWLSLIRDVGVTYPTVFEGNVEGSLAFVDGRAMPTTVFIDADGEVQKVWSGVLSDELLRSLIKEHLDSTIPL